MLALKSKAVYILAVLNPIDYSISKFVSFVDEETRAMISNLAKQVVFKKGRIIETRGEPAAHFYLIESGLVQLGINGIDGSQFNLTRLGPGHTFGETAFFLNHSVIHDAKAESDVTLFKLSRPVVDQLMSESLVFSKALVSVACMRVQTTLGYIGDTLGMPLDARVAKQILSVSASAKDAIVINVRQVDLAHSLGVSRVSIGKGIKSLAKQNLIKVGYGKLEVLDRKKLIDLVRQGERKL